ncbi:MAG: Rpn family recombination-promoting nuclease/putative transposase, partial [Anaerovorax sp.]
MKKDSQAHYRPLSELNLEDDFLFSKVMADEEVCAAVIEKILDIRIKKVKILTEQKTINLDLEAKGIRLDVYVEDENETVFAVEMQKGGEKNLPKRTRYYQGTIDLDWISKGEKYEKLRKSYIIFICTFDYFAQGRHKYTFENICLEDPTIQLKDDTQKIILNTKGILDDVDEETKAFLSYVESSTEEVARQFDCSLVKKVHHRVDLVKKDRRMEVEYMTLYERDERNREEGRREGRREGL